MAISRLDIAAAIASRFAAMTPPTGQQLRLATHLLPSQVAATPALLVFPPEETLSYPPSARHSLMEFPVRLYIARFADHPRQVSLTYRWMDALVPQLDGMVRLGLSGQVDTTDVTGARAGVLAYAGEDYDGIEMAVLVRASEAPTFAG